MSKNTNKKNVEKLKLYLSKKENKAPDRHQGTSNNTKHQHGNNSK
jgi:hypothetical protein